MGFNNIIKIFLPKDRVFYSLFEQVAVNLEEMGEIFKQAMEEPDADKRLVLLRKLEDGEHKNDNITHQIFIELGQNFITPFDREDIHQLAMALDDVADYMYASSKKIINYGIMEMDDYMKKMGGIVVKATISLGRAVRELRNMKNLANITEACVAVNSLENQADVLLDQALIKLFSEYTDPIEVIKLKDTYQDMEIITDKCEDASNVIESIIIKYS